ncbi:MAG: hypothetical protein AB7I38_06470 [Dehalococcoidia bacterium]
MSADCASRAGTLRFASAIRVAAGIAAFVAVAGTGCGDDASSARATASAAPFVLVSGTAAAATPRPRVTGTPVALPTPQPIAVDDEVWRRIAADTEGSLRPLLRPPSLPGGIETVLDKRLPDKPTPGFFDVEYGGPGKLLVITAGPPNPPPGFEPGHQDQITVRGQPGILAVGDDRDPNVSSWVYWEEPGVWRAEGAESTVPRVPYLVRGQGMSAEDLLAVVETLRPWTPE